MGGERGGDATVGTESWTLNTGSGCVAVETLKLQDEIHSTEQSGFFKGPENPFSVTPSYYNQCRPTYTQNVLPKQEQTERPRSSALFSYCLYTEDFHFSIAHMQFTGRFTALSSQYVFKQWDTISDKSKLEFLADSLFYQQKRRLTLAGSISCSQLIKLTDVLWVG